jgi:hypothetical protein
MTAESETNNKNSINIEEKLERKKGLLWVY